MIRFETAPARYRHWKLGFDGAVAVLTLDVDEEAGIRPGYRLKLNSYDLGVDIEFHDALQRVRFEHPEIGAVLITGGKERMFCAGANIYMLGGATHAWKVNFCRFTNETRNGMEDSSRHDGLRFVAALNGATAGGGYEIALACDEIVMVDDRSTTVSMPEVPLLGVLPGTGGLTRLTDKRRVRRDLADIFCTTAEGVRAERARAWNLVDSIARPQDFLAHAMDRARALARPRGPAGAGVALPPLEARLDENGFHYRHVDVALDRARRTATLTVAGPDEAPPADAAAMLARGAAWWPLAMARELDDAILMLRTNAGEAGTVILRTRGALDAVLAADRALLAHRDHWFARETIGLLRRALARLDVSPRSLFAIVDEGSCFAGTLAELLFAADRSYMLALPEGRNDAPRVALGEANLGVYPMVNGRARLAGRFAAAEPPEALRALVDRPLAAAEGLARGLVTFAPDELDWADEVRLAIEERASLSPDALTGMEANLRFGGAETPHSRIFGRLSAWQNWVFSRPNAVGERGALRLYGSGSRPQFDWERV